jgi:hypothetical protein
MDMQKIARDLFWKENRSKNTSSNDLCTLIGFQPIKLHNSGNDAAYTLVVLPSLASKILEKDTLENDTQGNDTHKILQETIQAALISAKTAR